MSKYTEDFPNLSTYDFDTIMCQLKQVCGADPSGLINAQFLSRPTTAKDIALLLHITYELFQSQVELQKQFVELYTFVKDFFENLDLQKEVNSWLDNALETGKLMTLFEKFVPYVTPEMYGAKGDGVTDDTNSFINALNSGKDIILTKSYLITSTLMLKNNTKISSMFNKRWDLNEGIIKTPKIIFSSVNDRILFKNDGLNQYNNYNYNIEINGINIETKTTNATCFDFKGLANSKLNFTCSGFDFVLVLNFVMRCEFSFNATNFVKGITFNGDLSTTCVFNECYLGQSKGESLCISVGKNMVYNAVFDNCTFESCKKLIVTNGNNFISFINSYMENIPYTSQNEKMYICEFNNNEIVSNDIINFNQCYLQGINTGERSNIVFINSNNCIVNISQCVIKLMDSLFDENFKGFANLYGNTEVTVNKITNSQSNVSYSNEYNLVTYYDVPSNKNRDKYISLNGKSYAYISRDVLVIKINHTGDSGEVGNLNISLNGCGRVLNLTTGNSYFDVSIVNGNIVIENYINNNTAVGDIVLSRPDNII